MAYGVMGLPCSPRSLRGGRVLAMAWPNGASISGSFVAPQWGPTKNAAFRYRLTVGKIENNRQTVRLYLTPQSGANAKEFLAFEYVCTRQ